jgi:ribose transport system substrate-binding protein
MVFIGYTVTLSKKDKPTIVVVLKGSDIQYWKIVKAGAEKAFKDFGVEGKVIAPETTYPAENQIRMLESVLLEKPKALIVAPTQPSITLPVLKEYKKNNIPVLLVDTEMDWSDQTVFIGTNNLTLGRKAGELLASMLQPGDRVALIVGGDSVFDERSKGAKETLGAAGIKIVTEQPGYDEVGNLKPVMENILQEHPEIKGVFATDDIMALHALEILGQKDLRIPVIGADGIIKIIEYIEKGTLTSTVAQNPYDMGYISVENAVKAMKGEQVQQRIDSGVDIITKDNAKEKLDFLEKVLGEK